MQNADAGSSGSEDPGELLLTDISENLDIYDAGRVNLKDGEGREKQKEKEQGRFEWSWTSAKGWLKLARGKPKKEAM